MKKILFSVLASFMLLLGLLLAYLGFYAPSTLEEKAEILGLQDEEIKKYLAILYASSYVIGVVGLSILGVGIIGLVAVNAQIKLLTCE